MGKNRRYKFIVFVLAVGVASLGVVITPKAFASKPVTMRGVFRLIHADGRLNESTLYSLEGQNGRLYELKGRGLWRRYSSGARVEIHGTRSGDSITVTSAVKLAPGPAPAPVIGSRNLLVINVVWSGGAITATKAQEDAFLFGTTDPQRRSMKQYYEDVSYGQFTWTGSETTNLTIANPGTCALSTIANSADTAATSAGYNLSAYNNKMYNFPSGLSCSSEAYGEIGGNRSWVQNGLWNINDGYERMKPAHEIGHNFGEYHGHGLECGAVTVSLSCLGSTTNIDEYGNSFDLMGNNWTSDNYDSVNWMGLLHQLNLGWLTASGRVLTTVDPGAAQTAAYTLKPIENSTGTVGLVINTSTRRYYIETRSAVGQDGFLTNWPDATSGILISMRDDISGGDGGSLNLDTAPNSCSSDYYCDFHDASLNVGQTFSDVDGQFQLTLDSDTMSGATFHIDWHGGGTSTDTTPPTITKKPTPQFTSSIGLTAVPVKLSWAATDASGICQFILSESANGGPWATVPLASATATSVTRQQKPGSNYTYSLQANDCANNGTSTSAPTYKVGKAEQSAASLAGTSWTSQSLSSASGGSVSYATANGNSASYTFTGKRIGLVTVKGPDRGSVDIYIDGTLKKSALSLYSSSVGYRKMVYQQAWTTAGTHTIRIVKAAGTRIDLDALVTLS